MAGKAGKRIGKLTARQVQTIKTNGLHSDGGGLYLKVNGGSKSWIFRWGSGGRETMGLGPTHTVSLDDARKRAEVARRQLLDGIDPREARRAAAVANKTITFDAAAKAYIDSHKAGWKTAKYAQKWRSTLEAYASPQFGKLAVSAIDVGMILKALAPIWTTKTRTASKVRSRIEAVLAWAKVQGYRSGENPALWRGNLDQLLPASGKVTKTAHHPAMPYKQVPSFMEELRAREGVAARALEFLLLTAARTIEVRGAKWDEIDLTAREWTVPAERMKRDCKHTVPLAVRCVAIIEQMQAIRRDDYVFPGRTRHHKPLGNLALLKLLGHMGYDGITVHGFRSSFRDWATEKDKAREVVAEAALSHGAKDMTDAAYRRATYVDERADLMQRWAAYCNGEAAKVIPIRARAN